MAEDPRLTPVVLFEEFLAPAELGWVHAYAAARESDFVPSEVIGADRGGVADPRYRRSRVLYDIDGFHDLLGRRILQTLPILQFRLGIAPFQVAGLEIQLTASSHGEYFRAHTDSDNGPVRGRTITFVYFCHREPRMFAGGALRIYGRDPATGADLIEVRHEIEPTQNSVVFFSSDRLLEITPVGSRSGALLDSRMTLNGWLHR
jgi:SM-20-related protein